MLCLFEESKCSPALLKVNSLKSTIIRFRSLSFVAPLVVIRCTTRCHSLYYSLSFVVTRCELLAIAVTIANCWIYCSWTLHNFFILKLKSTIIRFRSLSFVVPLVVIRCHSLSRNVPLACLFTNDLYGRLKLFKDI